jgi:serine/threonine protein kinase
MEDLTGREFGPYRIVAPLGEGGMAAVYKAYQANMDRYVALKVLPRHFANDAQFVARFEQEAKVLAKLRHPHILPVHDYGENDGYTYLVMPFIESGALVDLLRDEPLPLSKMERFVGQVGDALDYAHSQGIIHRDVKPSNVLVDERENCMLVDFGIAKIVEGSANLTQTGGVLGTPAYMSPEQGRGAAVDHRIDIYALGVILYEMATGRTPFKAETPIAVLVKHINDPLPPPSVVNPALPPAVEQVILKAMAKNPDDRFATAGEMVAALSAAVSDKSSPDSVSDDQTVTLSQNEPTILAGPQDSPESLSAGAQKRNLSYVWLLGAFGLGAVILMLIACGVLLFNLGGMFQPAVTTVASPAQGMEPAEIISTTSTPVADTSDSNELAVTTDEPAGDEVRQPTDMPPTETPSQIPPTHTPRPEPTATPVPTPGPASVVLTFGEEGIGPGLFTDARSVTVDNNTGHIYVGEYIGGRIQVFDETGKFITQWLVDTEMPLRGMDIDRTGNVYVVQSGLIYKYNGETGEQISEIKYDPGWGFDDIVVTADGGVVAPWFGGQDDIVRFNAKGEPVLTIAEAVSGQTGSSELDTRVAVDGLGNIYALATFNNAVLKFGPDGKFLDMFGSGGEGPGTLDSPMAIAVDGQGRIYVSELVGPIKIFDSGGQYLDSIDIQALGMRFNDQGDLFVASRTKVVKYKINLP